MKHSGLAPHTAMRLWATVRPGQWEETGRVCQRQEGGGRGEQGRWWWGVPGSMLLDDCGGHSGCRSPSQPWPKVDRLSLWDTSHMTPFLSSVLASLPNRTIQEALKKTLTAQWHLIAVQSEHLGQRLGGSRFADAHVIPLCSSLPPSASVPPCPREGFWAGCLLAPPEDELLWAEKQQGHGRERGGVGAVEPEARPAG